MTHKIDYLPQCDHIVVMAVCMLSFQVCKPPITRPVPMPMRFFPLFCCAVAAGACYSFGNGTLSHRFKPILMKATLYSCETPMRMFLIPVMLFFLLPLIRQSMFRYVFNS